MIERRSGNDRRTVERFSVSIEVEWESIERKENGIINDLSIIGCFILCSGDVDNGEYVKIWFPLTNGNKILLMAEVMNQIYDIGFGAVFINLSEAQREFLEVYVDTLRVD